MQQGTQEIAITSWSPGLSWSPLWPWAFAHHTDEACACLSPLSHNPQFSTSLADGFPDTLSLHVSAFLFPSLFFFAIRCITFFGQVFLFHDLPVNSGRWIHFIGGKTGLERFKLFQNLPLQRAHGVFADMKIETSGLQTLKFCWPHAVQESIRARGDFKKFFWRSAMEEHFS